MTNAPYAFISRPIPYPERRRVFVTKRGPGFTQHRITLAGALIAISVMLDSEQSVDAFPSDIRPYDDSEPSNVVRVEFRRAPVREMTCSILGGW